MWNYSDCNIWLLLGEVGLLGSNPPSYGIYLPPSPNLIINSKSPFPMTDYMVLYSISYNRAHLP